MHQLIRILVLFVILFSANYAQAQFGPPSFNLGAPGDTQYIIDPRFNETDYIWSAEPAGFDPFLPETGELLIITTEEYEREIIPFVHWKKQRGFLVFVESIESIGNEQEKIEDTIKQHYALNNVRYVLLIGDHDQIIPHKGTVGNVDGEAADPMYSLIDGDIYPDLFISRIPVNSSKELRVVLNKTIRYEKGEETDEDWYSQGIAIGSDEGGTTYYDLNDSGDKVPYEGEKDRTIAKHLAESLIQAGYSDVAELFDTESSAASKERLIEELNQGAGLVYYLGHGVEHEWKTTHFSNADISQLKNYNKTPVIISVACSNGNFEWIKGDSFAETWISAGTEEVGTGAVAILASSTIQPWTPPTVGIKEMINSISTAKYKSLGAIFTNGVIKFLRKKRKQIIETFQSWHIFGDATIELRTKLPTEIYYVIDDSIKTLEDFNYQIEEGTKITALQGHYLLARGESGMRWDVLRQIENNTEIKITLTGKDKLAKEITFKKSGEYFVQQ